MEKPSPPSSPSSSSNGSFSMEPKCIGRLEIARPKPVGFLCGSIPVPTDNSFHAFNSALIPSRRENTVTAPRYRMIPAETDLNTLPVVANLPEKVLPVSAVHSKATGELPWEGDAVSSNLTRKCEALAVSGLAEYGDEIDVIAPTDILKQIFKMPYSKGRLSIAVRRVGQTLVLNTGPDVEEGEKLVRRHKNQSKCADQSLFLNFAMHSVRMEACDCPPMHHSTSEEQSNSSVLRGACTSNFVGQSDSTSVNEENNNFSEYTQVKPDGYVWESKKNDKNKDHHPVKKASHIGEKPRCSVQESEKHKRISNDGFLRVLFWQFHNFRMLLGSDLLLFSNEKYVSVSLHLWDVTRQVTPLTWLEAWLDNVMASVPELAICYHRNGVVQGYELLKTDDIFLLKGISEDGTPAFHPQVVQQNGLTVLRFLQENCEQDPGAYWLYKSAGEDVIQLFDLSIIPKSHASNNCDDSSSPLPSLLYRGRSNSLFSLGTLLYRIAHRLSLSLASNNRSRCVRFFRKCLEFLDEPDHLVVRALAHEQYARLLLNDDEELGLTFPSESFLSECEVTVPVESLDSSSSISESVVYENLSSSVPEDRLSEDGKNCSYTISEASVKMTLEANLSDSRKLLSSCETESDDSGGSPTSSNCDEDFAVSKTSPESPETPCVVQTVADPISSKLAAIHHVSQAIKSLRWMRQIQGTEVELLDEVSSFPDRPHSSMNLSLCACGDSDCIEVCDILEWLPTSKIDHKMWKLVLLLGESYLALGQAYKEDNQLHQTLKVVELACTVYGSMPQHLEDTRFLSSMIKYSPGLKCIDKKKKAISYIGDAEVKHSVNDDSLALERISATSLFWSKAWTLVGDVYVEFHFIKSKEDSTQPDTKSSAKELRMSSEVVKEVQRLKTKLGKYIENCSSCSLVNCSCQSDRASSGSSASSSSGNKPSVVHGRKHGKRSHAKSASSPPKGESDPCIETIAQCSVATNSNNGGGVGQEIHEAGVAIPCQSETTSKDKPQMRIGGIFRYTRDPVVGDAEQNLSTALICYDEAIDALVGVPSGSAEVESIIKKIGWVCNELGRDRLERKELTNAEHAFADAITAFREVSDHCNIILINCNLGHGRRALAEELIAKYENLKSQAVFQDACKQALDTAKIEYRESLRYYGAAKSELNAITKEDNLVSNSLKNEACTQYAHTYLRLGMLLAREDVTAEIYENGALEDKVAVRIRPGHRRNRRELRKHEISANDAIREALSVYESLGDLRKQEAAFAYFQLACYQRDSCLKFLESDHNKSNFSKNENSILHRVKQYASLAERNWQKAMEFYGPTTHPSMYLTILTQRSALLLSLSLALHSHAMLESSLSRMLEGRHISETISDSFASDYPEIHGRFWVHLQKLLKNMLSSVVSGNTDRSSTAAVQLTSSSNKPDIGKLRELYKMSLKSTDFSQLHSMNELWSS
ncbi:Erythroid differentiation-related factor 1 [Euphorbia peplus]|nr:Erythroid differentiation-related factor 1 [Euphorbia peplus]